MNRIRSVKGDIGNIQIGTSKGQQEYNGMNKSVDPNNMFDITRNEISQEGIIGKSIDILRDHPASWIFPPLAAEDIWHGVVGD